MSERVPDLVTLRRLRYQLEDGTYLGSCDWGCCDREQVGWAWSSRNPEDDWLAICGPCADGEGKEADPYPVDGFVTFEAVWSGLGAKRT
jgi:hypothetical protein